MKTIVIKEHNFLPEIVIFIFAFITRFLRLNVPSNHVFDEVYHAFTAREMFKGNPAAWEWWNSDPAGFAYEWSHPPLAKEFMTIAISIFGDNAFAWRFFSAFFGVGVIILIYFLTLKLFKNRLIALLAAAIASMDGLLLTMSRIAMNDIYFLFFVLLGFLFFLYDKKLLMGITLGLAIASKWTGFFGIGIIGAVFTVQQILKVRDRDIKLSKFFRNLIVSSVFFIIIPLAVYLISYLPFFLGNHVPPDTNYSNVETFVELQKQMYWYHTDLVASHDYQSIPVQWVFNLRPIWIYGDYKDINIASIYVLGNPILMWVGLISIVFLIFEYIRKGAFNLALVLVGYFGFFVPWIFSPRIMFYYHYLPSAVFLTISTAYMVNWLLKINRGKVIAILFLISLFISFFYFLPLWTAVYFPDCYEKVNCTSLYESYFWLKSWK